MDKINLYTLYKFLSFMSLGFYIGIYLKILLPSYSRVSTLDFQLLFTNLLHY